MDNREWIARTLRRQECDAVPYDFMFSPPAQKKAEAHYGPNLEEALSFPMRMAGPNSVKPLYANPAIFGESARDDFDVVWSTSEIDRGAPIRPCLPEPDLSGYTFPDAKAEARFADLAAWCAAQRTNYRVIWVADLWERAGFMRGIGNLLLDVALNRPFVERLLRELTDYALQTMEVLFARFEFEAVALSDDYGMQQGMIMSPSDWRQLIKPRLSEIYGMAKKHGRDVFHHSCGNIVPIVGDLIDIGLDILHPIQPEAMDILSLKKEFGARVTFCGGLRTQDLLVTATPQQIRAEVRRLKREMGKGGGYILEPGITIQADVPAENIVAMIDEARVPG